MPNLRRSSALGRIPVWNFRGTVELVLVAASSKLDKCTTAFFALVNAIYRITAATRACDLWIPTIHPTAKQLLRGSGLRSIKRRGMAAVDSSIPLH